MTQYLQGREQYEERYDRMTVEDCLRQERSLLEAHKEYENELEAKGHAIVNQCAWEIKKILLTKDWYDKKEATVVEWMQADEARDKMERDGVSPKNILCKTCYDHMLEESRSTWEREGKEEVLFFMRCPGGHLPMQCVFQDGTELIIKESLCPECNAVVNAKRLPSEKAEVKTKYSCSSCDYEEIDAFSLSNDTDKDDTDFQANRSRFCLSGQGLKDVQEAVLNMDRMKALVDTWKHEDENKEQYDAAAQLQKLTIPQVKELIAATFEKTDYSNLLFEKPSIEKYVSIEFSLEELETDNQLASTSDVRKLIKKTLQNTNWRLMTDGISYRLGLMSGRLRAYESKEDLLKLVAKH
jgi:hypothetical protein